MSTVRNLRVQLTTFGPLGMARLSLQHRFRRRLRSYDLFRAVVEGAHGLEIGGPSAIFARTGMLPLYPLLERLDNCDFAGNTIWHATKVEGSPFEYDAGRTAGTTYIRDATALHGIEAGAYDLVLASHTLEHVANPLRALAEWKRVLRPSGHLILVVPHLENTFDHRRPVTTLDHLEDDFARSTPESDDTHVQEFISLCDLGRVPEPLSPAEFEARVRRHAENRAIHHHVFDTDLVVRLLDRARYELLAVEPALPFHIVVLARAAAVDADNESFVSDAAAWRRTSVFGRDRHRRAA
jgi:SAM-dependent methyltransferase